MLAAAAQQVQLGPAVVRFMLAARHGIARAIMVEQRWRPAGDVWGARGGTSEIAHVVVAVTMHNPPMDLTFVGWIVVGLIAGLISGVIAGGRSARGWMPSLAIGLIAALLTGWLLTTFAGVDGITSIWVSALFATAVAIVLRLLMKTVSFSGD